MIFASNSFLKMKKNKLLPKFSTGSISGGAIYIVFIVLAIGLMGVTLTNGPFPAQNPINTNSPVTPVVPILDAGKKNLQLYTFGYTTPAPTVPPQPTVPPTSTCRTMIKPPTCQACDHGASMLCKESPCNSPAFPFPVYDPDYTCAYMETTNKTLYDQKKTDPNCIEACIAKPVIYLYPTTPTLVDVSVKVPGNIFISDPLYPDGGWKNVLAHPNGSLLYENKKYSELFFESDVDKVNPPDNGIVIAKRDLKKTLTDTVTKLGLIGAEKEEFLDFWIPVLNDLDSPYILFSILDDVEKERVDHVEISPRPDTFIAFIAYFKPLTAPPTDIKPLNLPESPPERIGFTAVEWGGTIDY